MDIQDSDTVLSAGILYYERHHPVLKAVNDRFGIVNGHVEICACLHNDQNLIDNYRQGTRRGRSAPPEHGYH